VKSFFVGLLTLLIALIPLIVLVIVGLIVYNSTHPTSDGSVGWDPISLYKQSFLGYHFAAAFVFASGFFWEWRPSPQIKLTYHTSRRKFPPLARSSHRYA
jgi:hypothetical protein